MGGVTKDQIERARQIDVLDYALRYEYGNIRRVGDAYRMKDHPSIEIKRRKWRWYSQGLYGNTALDFLTDVRGYSLVDAVCLLLNEQPQGQSGTEKTANNSNFGSTQSATNPPPERLEFTLPRRNKNNNRVIAYLQSRGIDKDLILDCISRGDLFESAQRHDCVFKGKDENGKTRYAAIRSTTSGYKGESAGSDKRFSFILQPTNQDSTVVAVFESPTDALSHQSMCKQGYIAPFDGWRLSLGGTSLLGLKCFLERYPHIRSCLSCTDNDVAGYRTALQISGLPDITVERHIPDHGNDWNDALQATQKAERIQKRAQSHIFAERS